MTLPRLLTSTSRRTLVLTPAVVAVEQAVGRRPLDLRWLPLLACRQPGWIDDLSLGMTIRPAKATHE